MVDYFLASPENEFLDVIHFIKQICDVHVDVSRRHKGWARAHLFSWRMAANGEDPHLGSGPDDDDDSASPGRDGDSDSILSDDSVLPPYTRETPSRGEASSLYQACACNNRSSLRRALQRGVTKDEVMELDNNGKVRDPFNTQATIWYLSISNVIDFYHWLWPSERPDGGVFLWLHRYGLWTSQLSLSGHKSSGQWRQHSSDDRISSRWVVSWNLRTVHVQNMVVNGVLPAGHISTVMYLLNYYPGIDMEMKDCRGFTALIKAAMTGRCDVVAALVMAGMWEHDTYGDFMIFIY